MSRVTEAADDAKSRLARARERWPVLDHVIRMQQRYGAANASQQAGAVTYFAFLSFFPLLALGFFVVGIVARVYPGVRQNLLDGIDQVLPGLIGNGSGELSLDDVQTFAGFAAVIGVLGVLYAGLGWLSSLREALVVVFDLPPGETPNFVVGKLRDLISLVLLGVVLIGSVAISGVVGAFSGALLDLVGLETTFAWLVTLVSVLLGLAANALLFYSLFRLLAAPPLSNRALWSGAALGAIGFEILKQLSSLLLASTKNQPAFQAFGIALILVVWFNYFSRVVLYAAAWAHTDADATADREAAEAQRLADEEAERTRFVAPTEPQRLSPAAVFAAGAASAVALVGVVRRRARPPR
ncbi:inner membrane protein YhjD [Marmoricola endophyticus]|uniref:Inner membrane protein YhjD n=1 Tax=Marmoricola endophyticus TaxID=2040280 RepID=A0A917B9R3_9ACTN|nr:YihY/virulence factor BrkB family protein [Marmoricola endophyticus]GGF33236.1 inner membrane protein YhjD [Marmoricola endophyticus]